MSTLIETPNVDKLSAISQELLAQGKRDITQVSRHTLQDNLLNENLFDLVTQKVETFSGYKDITSRYALLRMSRDINYANSKPLTPQEGKVELVKQKDAIIDHLKLIIGLVSDQELELEAGKTIMSQFISKINIAVVNGLTTDQLNKTIIEISQFRKKDLGAIYQLLDSMTIALYTEVSLTPTPYLRWDKAGPRAAREVTPLLTQYLKIIISIDISITLLQHQLIIRQELGNILVRADAINTEMTKISVINNGRRLMIDPEINNPLSSQTDITSQSKRLEILYNEYLLINDKVELARGELTSAYLNLELSVVQSSILNAWLEGAVQTSNEWFFRICTVKILSQYDDTILSAIVEELMDFFEKMELLPPCSIQVDIEATFKAQKSLVGNPAIANSSQSQNSLNQYSNGSNNGSNQDSLQANALIKTGQRYVTALTDLGSRLNITEQNISDLSLDLPSKDIDISVESLGLDQFQIQNYRQAVSKLNAIIEKSIIYSIDLSIPEEVRQDVENFISTSERLITVLNPPLFQLEADLTLISDRSKAIMTSQFKSDNYKIVWQIGDLGKISNWIEHITKHFSKKNYQDSQIRLSGVLSTIRFNKSDQTTSRMLSNHPDVESLLNSILQVYCSSHGISKYCTGKLGQLIYRPRDQGQMIFNLYSLTSLNREIQNFQTSRYFKTETEVREFFDSTRILSILKDNFLPRIAAEFLDSISDKEIIAQTKLTDENDGEALITPGDFRLPVADFKREFWKMVGYTTLKLRNKAAALDWDILRKKANPPPPPKPGNTPQFDFNNMQGGENGEGDRKAPKCLFKKCGAPHASWKCPMFITNLREDALKTAIADNFCLRCMSISMTSQPNHRCSGEYQWFCRKTSKYKKSSSDCDKKCEIRGKKLHWSLCLRCRKAKKQKNEGGEAGRGRGIKGNGKDKNKGRGRGRGRGRAGNGPPHHHNQLSVRPGETDTTVPPPQVTGDADGGSGTGYSGYNAYGEIPVYDPSQFEGNNEGGNEVTEGYFGAMFCSITDTPPSHSKPTANNPPSHSGIIANTPPSHFEVTNTPPPHFEGVLNAIKSEKNADLKNGIINPTPRFKLPHGVRGDDKVQPVNQPSYGGGKHTICGVGKNLWIR